MSVPSLWWVSALSPGQLQDVFMYHDDDDDAKPHLWVELQPTVSPPNCDLHSSQFTRLNSSSQNVRGLDGVPGTRGLSWLYPANF